MAACNRSQGLEHLRPFLGSSCVWSCAENMFSMPRLPVMLPLIVRFLTAEIRRCPMARRASKAKDLGEVFRLDVRTPRGISPAASRSEPSPHSSSWVSWQRHGFDPRALRLRAAGLSYRDVQHGQQRKHVSVREVADDEVSFGCRALVLMELSCQLCWRRAALRAIQESRPVLFDLRGGPERCFT